MFEHRHIRGERMYISEKVYIWEREYIYIWERTFQTKVTESANT